MTPAELATSWADSLGLSPSSEVLAMAGRRICACGRLAQLPPLLHLAWIVRVEVLEHGDGPPHLAEGTAHATVWVMGPNDAVVQRHATQVHQVVQSTAWDAGQLLTVAVRRASWRDRLRAWLRWQVWRLR